MENSELLQAIENIVEQSLAPMKSDLEILKEDQAAMKSDIQTLKEDQAAMKKDLQQQIKDSEANLRAEIVKSENMILGEVSRVHHILNDHIADKLVHTA